MPREVLERIGSSKSMKATCVIGVINQEDNGTTSVFDWGAIPDFVSDRIRRARVSQTNSIFNLLESNGVQTHRLAALDSGRGFRVREVSVRDLPFLSLPALKIPRMIGLEVLIRTRISKKTAGRIEMGDLKREDLVLAEGEKFEPGAKFVVPCVEFSTKWEEVDGYLSVEQAMEVGELDANGIKKLKAFASQIGLVIDTFVESLGYELVDFKIEVALDPETGNFIVIDSLSLDEMGLTKDGVQYGKNPLRDHYKVNESEWCEALAEAQEAGLPKDEWPKIPSLPDKLKSNHEDRYEMVAKEWHMALAA